MKTLRIARFFLGTVLFSLKSNASYAIIIPFVALVYATGDSDKHMILAAMLALGASPLLCGGMLFKLKHDARADSSRQWLWPHLLPVEPKMLVRGMALAALVYALLTQGLMIRFLDHVTCIPSNAAISAPDVNGVRVMRFGGRDQVGDEWGITKLALPSVIFGAPSEVAYPIFPGWRGLLPALFVLMSMYAAMQWCLVNVLRQRNDPVITHGRTALWIVTAVLAALVAGDMLLAPGPIYAVRTWMDAAPWAITTVVTALILGYGAGCVHALGKRRFTT